MSERSVYLGVHTTPEVKAALESESERTGESMSALAHRILSQRLRGASVGTVDPGRPWKRGRRPAIRGVLTPEFRAAILGSSIARYHLAYQAGFTDAQSFSYVLRDTPIVMTSKTLSRLRKVAEIVGYAGSLTCAS